MTSETMYGSWSLRVDNSKPTLEALVDTPVHDSKDKVTSPAVANEGDDNSELRIPVSDHD